MVLKLRYWSLSFLLILALGLFFERPARAYTDPGSCLLLFQTVGAVASGVLFYFRRRLRSLFPRTSTKPAVPPPVILSQTEQ